MKISTPNDYPFIKNELLAKVVERQCDGDDYDAGVLEAAARTARKTSEMLGRLIDALAESGNLTKEQLAYVVFGYAKEIEILS